MGFKPMGRYCSQSGEGCTVTFSKTSALYRGQRLRSSSNQDGGTLGKQLELRRVADLWPNCRHFARHAVVAPQIGPVRDGLVVDLDFVGTQRGAGAPKSS
jgi:hypothetical protein